MNKICLILGHKKIVRGWYPHDPITTITCLRCDEVLEEKPNPNYFEGFIYPLPPWHPAFTNSICNYKQIISLNDPYGEEQWEVE